MSVKIIYPNGKQRKGRIINCTECSCEKVIYFHQKQQSFICDSCKLTRDYKTFSCGHCGKELVRKKTRIKSEFLFCDRKCKDSEQRLGGILELEQYTSTKTNYRKIALNYYGMKCFDCEIIDNYLLVVHHKDGNHKNNDLTNLEVLCHNHHAERHKKFVNGEWILNQKQIFE